MIRRRSVIAGLFGGAATVQLPRAIAQTTYPSRPIRIVVPFSPGGNTDVVARLYAEKLSTLLGVTVIVENRAGAGTVIGTDYVAKSAPDGYILLFGTSAYTVNASLYSKLPYDPRTSLTAVALVAEVPLVIAVNPTKISAGSATEFVDLLRQNPGKYAFASAGNGSAIHMAVELLKYQEQLVITHVPYRGAGPALIDVVAGQVDFLIDAVSTAGQFVKSGRLNAIAVTSETRSAVLPDVPTMKEAGFADYATTIWNVVLAPSGTPAPIIAQLAQALAAAAKDQELRRKLHDLGVEPLSAGPVQAAQRVQREMQAWRTVITAAGIKSE